MAASRFLIISFGSIGRRHAANLRALRPDASIAVWRQHSRKPAVDAPASAIDKWLFSLAEAIDFAPDAVFVCGPAPTHVCGARPFAARNIPVLIEKPLAADVNEARSLLDATVNLSRPPVVGYQLRFAVELQALRRELEMGDAGRIWNVRAEVGQFLPNWRSGDYRAGVTARSELGGGALLELSHEIDYVLWLAGDVNKVNCLTGRVSDLDIDTEDLAEINCEFTSGAIGHIHLDLLQRPPRRGCRISGSKRSFEIDLLARRLRDDAGKTIANGEGQDCYRDEMNSFLAYADGSEWQGCTLVEAVRVMDVIAAARRSAAEERTVRLNPREPTDGVALDRG